MLERGGGLQAVIQKFVYECQVLLNLKLKAHGRPTQYYILNNYHYMPMIMYRNEIHVEP